MTLGKTVNLCTVPIRPEAAQDESTKPGADAEAK